MISFARITAQHDSLTISVTPCGRALYNWLLRRYPAGKVQEIELEEFVKWSGTTRRKRGAYSLAHAKRALKELFELGLVKEIKRYTGKVFKLIAHHPEPAEEIINDQNRSEMIKNGTSNPCCSVLSYRDRVERNTEQICSVDKNPLEVTRSIPPSEESLPRVTSPTVPKPVKKQKLDRKTLKENKVAEFLATIPQSQVRYMVEASELGVKLCRNLLRAMHGKTDQIILQAINALKKASGVQNPTGWFISAVRDGYAPNHTVADEYSHDAYKVVSFQRPAVEPELDEVDYNSEEEEEIVENLSPIGDIPENEHQLNAFEVELVKMQIRWATRPWEHEDIAAWASEHPDNVAIRDMDIGPVLLPLPADSS